MLPGNREGLAMSPASPSSLDCAWHEVHPVNMGWNCRCVDGSGCLGLKYLILLSGKLLQLRHSCLSGSASLFMKLVGTQVA